MNRPPDAIRTAVAGPEHEPGLRRLFDQACVPCHCRYWHFAGDKYAWQERCALAPETNAAEMQAALELGSAEMMGVVATLGDAVVGWSKIAPATAMTRLYEQRLYRGLPCFDGDRAGIFTVGCMLVDTSWRRRGVASRLLARGVELARSSGGRAVEAFPRRAEGVADAELWTGPLGVFLEAGFRIVHDFRPYPVLRLDL